MNTIYNTRTEAEGVALCDPSLDDHVIIECDGGFKFEVAPPDNFQDDNFLTGEPIPHEVRKKPIPPNFHNKTLIDDWEQPLEIVSELLPIQAFNCDLLPIPLREFVKDNAHRMQTPPDFCAISTLVIISSIIGAGCGVRPKQLDDWEVIPNLWGSCVGNPSMLKTPSMKESLTLLERLQAQYSKEFEAQKTDADFDALTLEAAKNEIEKQIKKEVGKKDGNVNKLKAEFAELMQSAPVEMARRIFKTNETSVQSMTVLQNQNPKGLLVFRDEIMGLLSTWDRDDKADERAYFLEGWNGNGSYTDFKLNRGLTDAKNICISLLGSIQPDKLNKYLMQARKGSNDGLVQRFQLAVYPDELEKWQYHDIKPNREEKERVFGILEKLCELDFSKYGANQGEYDERPFFRFSLDAQQVFIAWLDNLQNVKLKDDNSLIVEHLSKYRSLMPSLALLFHIVECVDGDTNGDISADCAILAARWCDYLETHARRIYGMNATPAQTTALNLLKRIKAGDLPNPFTAKDAYRKCWHGLGSREEVESACNVLIDANYLKIETPQKPKVGKAPLPKYFVSPLLK
jgi:hypothetical protein